jgi:nucleoid DNA-binding protein
MLKYSLTRNLLTDSADDYTAKAQSLGSYNKEAIITDMLRRGSLLTRTDIVAVLNGFEESIADIIHDGGTVNTPLFNTSFSISGKFEGGMDNFDHKRHKVNVNLNKGILIRNAEAKVIPEKTGAIANRLQILEVVDSVSGTMNEQLTPGGVLKIWGDNIKISGDNPDCGLYFVPTSGDTLKAQVIAQNKPKSIIIAIPPLAAGTYTLKLVTQFTHSHMIKSPRTCFFNKALVVV